MRRYICRSGDATTLGVELDPHGGVTRFYILPGVPGQVPAWLDQEQINDLIVYLKPPTSTEPKWTDS